MRASPGARAVGMSIKDLLLPQSYIVSGIIRRGEIVLPRGLKVLQEGVEILTLIDDNGRSQLADVV